MKYLLILLLLASCGSGGSGTPEAQPAAAPESPAMVRFWDFAPYMKSRIGRGTFGEWKSTLVHDGADILWGDTTEEHRFRQYAGQTWMVLEAYRTPPYRYTVRTTRVEMNDGSGWVSLPTGHGNPYVPIQITKAITVRQWGWISDDPAHCAQVGFSAEKCRDHTRYFWQHTIAPNGLVTNVCWKDAQTNTRETLKQQEAWWDSEKGWYLPRSAPGEMKDGIPTGEKINYLWHQTIGREAGYFWTGANGECLYE